MQAQAVSFVGLSPDEKVEALELLVERERRKGQRLFMSLYPDEDSVWDGPSVLKKLMEPGQWIPARRHYAKHLEFFAAGAKYRERMLRGGNRSGKTICGGYETAAHLTGQYPHWWIGRRFLRPVSWWAAGKNGETTRDIVQTTLLGEVLPMSGGRKLIDGCGLIPGERLGRVSWKSGVQDQVDTIKVRHASGGWSSLGFKAYEQGRGSFEGTGQHGIWFDEEPPMAVFGEALIRTATTGGMVYLTLTPLLGRTDVVKSFMPTVDQIP